MNNKKKPMRIVWFKRDLRIQDHSALTLAAEQGAVLPLYIVEPELWQQPDASQRRWIGAATCRHWSKRKRHAKPLQIGSTPFVSDRSIAPKRSRS